MLKPYISGYFGILAGWITDPELLLQFAGTEFSYPITREQLSDYQKRRPDRRFYMGFSGSIPVFFGEIIPQEGTGPRLGRLLVGEPGKRGKGLGQVFVRLMIAECKRLYNASIVELYTWEKNESAIKCYKKVGFQVVDPEAHRMVHEGREFILVKMRVGTNDDKLIVG